MISGSERERVEDRVAREVVDVLCAIDTTRTGTRRPPRDAVQQPLVEGLRWEPAGAPRYMVVIREAKAAQQLKPALALPGP